MLKCSRRTPGYFTLIGDKAPSAARASNVILTQETVGSVCVKSVAYSGSMDEAMDVARSALQGVHYHADVICMLS